MPGRSERGSYEVEGLLRARQGSVCSELSGTPLILWVSSLERTNPLKRFLALLSGWAGNTSVGVSEASCFPLQLNPGEGGDLGIHPIHTPNLEGGNGGLD